MKERIHTIVTEALIAQGASKVTFAVEHTTDLTHGDYAVNAAMVAAKQLGKKPHDLACKLAETLIEALGGDVTSVEVAGPGFINITLSQSSLLAQLEEALAAGDEWGRGGARHGERTIIEYGNPNPFKEMHVGHLMGAVIGESLSRLIENAGATIARDTFGGDVGPHVAKALWGLQHTGSTEPTSAAEIGKAYTYGSRSYDENPKIKEEIDQLNVMLYQVVAEQGHPETLSQEERQLLKIWQAGRTVSMHEFERLYKILGTRFDYVFYDSDTTVTGLKAVRDGLAKGIFEESDGAVVYKGEKKGLHTLVFITSRGTPTYETKDIGLAFIKEERWSSDRSIIITANEQIGHFQVMLAALGEVAPLLAKKTQHIPHGFLQLTTGKMSSRSGTTITAVALLESVVTQTLKKNADPIIAQQVAVGAVKYMVLRQSPGADIIFDPEKSLSLDGDSGPYLQYALVRARSILNTATKEKKEIANTVLTQEAPDKPYKIARLIVRFPDIVAHAEATSSPNILTTYLTELAGAWNSFYAQERIIGGEYEAYKLSLALAFAATMQRGLTLLGIPAPEKM